MKFVRVKKKHMVQNEIYKKKKRLTFRDSNTQCDTPSSST